MTAEPASTEEPRTGGSPRARSVFAGIAGVLAVLGLIAGVLGLWVLHVATDSGRFERHVDEALEREDVSDALSRRILDEVAAAVDLRGAVVDLVPDRVEPLADLLLAGVRARADDRLAAAIRSDPVRKSIAGAAGDVYGQVVRLLEGERALPNVSVADGEVRVNLLPLVGRALGLIQDIGLLRDVDLPALERGGDPADQRARLGEALGRELPPDFGEVVIFRSATVDSAATTLRAAQDLLVLARRAAWLFVLLGLALAVLAVWLARNRLRAAVAVGAGAIVTGLVVRLVVGRATDSVPDLVQEPAAQSVLVDVIDDLERSLTRTTLFFAVLVAVVFVGAMLAIRRRPA